MSITFLPPESFLISWYNISKKEVLPMRYTTKEKRQLVMRYQNGESAAHICEEEGIARSTFYSWIKPFQTTVTGAGTLVTPQEFVALQRKVKRQDEIIQVLKRVNCTVSRIFALSFHILTVSRHTNLWPMRICLIPWTAFSTGHAGLSKNKQYPTSKMRLTMRRIFLRSRR